MSVGISGIGIGVAGQPWPGERATIYERYGDRIQNMTAFDAPSR